MRTAAELVLSDAPDAVPRARAFAASTLADEPVGRVDDVQLVVTELVTNAVFHGAAPITLRLSRGEGTVRVEVQDAGRAVPVKSLRRLDAMTGRGLELVTALTTGWGVEPCDGGKVVWAEVGDNAAEPDVDPFADVDALLAAWDDEPEPEPRYDIRLGAVPTELLLSAKSHSDNIVRELLLLSAEQAAGGKSLPAPMAALVQAATVDFAEARTEIKRQALEAAHRGDQTVELSLRLPLSAAAAGERYLAALEESDRHARAARLLTLAPPRSHQAFRRWYVESLVGQLRTAAAGGTPVPPPPFPQVLANEVDRLSSLEASWERLQLLQRITAELTGARSVEQIARTVVDNALTFAGVLTARVYLLSEDRVLRSLAWSGSSPDAARYDEVPLTSDLPGAVVARTGQPVFLRSLSHIAEQYPPLAGYYPDDRSLHVVPLIIEDHVLGVLSLTFAGGELEDQAQISFVRAIADLLAQAIERARANVRAAAERGRDRQLLNAQLDVLAGIVAGKPLAAALTALLEAVQAVSSGGMLASVLLLDDDGQHLRHLAAPSLPDFYNEAIDGIEIGPSVGSCGTAAYTRKQVIVEDVQVDPLWADYRELADRAGLRACWSTPILGARGRLLGTFAMYYPQPQRPGPSDLALIDVLVRTSAMAIERSRRDEERERLLAAERDAALTLQHSMLPDVPAAVGPVRLEGRYRTGDPGVEIGGDWYDAVPVDGGVMLVVGDVQGHDLQAAALMGQLRTVARAAAVEGQHPGHVLQLLHRYLDHVDTELLTTALVVHLDTQTGTATIASAGHLPPMLVTTTSTGLHASEVEIDPGPPLGLGGTYPHHEVTLPPGSVLLLYTDGLVENRAWPLDHGFELLRKELESQPPGTDLGGFLDAALELVPTGSRGDDVALLGALTPQ